MKSISQIKILNNQGQEVKDFSLPDQLLKLPIKPQLVHQVVVAYAANARAGTAHTKNRAEVSGGGKKPWRQKGTGRARHGSIRSPLWVGGGVVFGPRNTRNYKQRLPQQLKNQAKKMVVADYFTTGRVVVIEEFPQADKTKIFAELMRILKINNRRVLVLLTEKEKYLHRAMRNLAGVEIMAIRELNAYDGLRYPKWLVSVAGASELIKQIS